MDLGRREFGTAAGASLSALLAGCSALGDEQSDGDETDTETDDTDDAGDTEESGGGEDPETETDVEDEQKVYEDESMPGEVVLSDEADRHLEAVRETFSWMNESPGDTCHVHVMLANDSGADLTVDMTARIYDEDGTELSSTTSAGVAGPEPDEDDAVYSIELNNCEATAEYELEVTVADVAGEFDEEDLDEADEETAEETDEADEADVDDSDDGETDPDDGEPDEEEQAESDDDSDGQNETDDTDDADDEEDADDADDGESVLRVTVQDEDGDPIDHATVEVDGAGLFNWGETRDVDDQGRAEFDLEDGAHTLTAEADGYSPVEETVEVDGDTEHAMTLEADGSDESDEDETNTLTVFVRDGDDDPIDHATVAVDESGFGGASESQNVDDRGRAEFDLEDGEYELTAAADGYPTLEETVALDTDLEYTATLRAGD
ncbi:carboxypeptidase-like regulatory domain-containing protein [Natronococcus sp.]|uniref:carboxypeptidase-like regulatory domain-containing protein n=1 Tax=Natronococcus sp. TaxID=35747 RepID=UPI003A4D91F1